jgi:glycosyltransferase involved in cell wall biosynthesis
MTEMNAEPLVSIVTPSFNQAAYLEAAIRSVLTQDYTHVEYIVMDGGSTDGSTEILEKYSDQIDFWVSEPDQGQADAINRGIRKAQGEIIAWLNSDDVYLPEAVSHAVKVLNSEPGVGMVYGDGIMVGENLEIYDYHHYPQLNLVDLLAFEVILQPATFIRRNVLEEVGLLNSDYNLILDHELWVRIANKYLIKHVPGYWALERTHEQAKTIALAEQFVAEAEHMIEAARASDDLGTVVRENSARIYAGLGVFTARRLIDAKKHRDAFSRITQATFKHPATVARYWYKWVQAALSTLGLDPLFMWYRRTRRRLLYAGRRIELK